MKPFLKWPGGKRQIVKTLIAQVPKDYDCYYEPFVGAGALFFELLPPCAVLSDANVELMNTYTILRDDVDSLIQHLKKHINESEYYYNIRAKDPIELSLLERASRFIYLNRACYNGLYRENAKGKFNASFANYPTLDIVREAHLRQCSEALRGVTIRCGDYSKVLADVKQNDFVYFDPPYVASKLNYKANGFTIHNQRQLAMTFDALSNKGVRCMLSNSNDSFTIDLYKQHKIIKIQAARRISTRLNDRGRAENEVLILTDTS